MANTKITNPKLFNLGDSTSATQLPVMTTAERIAIQNTSIGETIFNSDTDKVEYFDGTNWYGISYEQMDYTVDYLIIAGGGSGGNGGGVGGGGGGAGGYLTSYNNEPSGGGGATQEPLTFVTGTVYTINVGQGGNGGFGYTPAQYNPGGNSSISGPGITTITAIGGGTGNGYIDSGSTSPNGGSGGGGGYANGYPYGSGTAGQGYRGNSGVSIYSGGGGGGAGSIGGTGSAGAGGSGLASTITGTSIIRAGGGGGGMNTWQGGGAPGSGGTGGGGAGGARTGSSSETTPGNGVDGTGSGGGGGGRQTNGYGGNGTVILRMPTSIYSGSHSSQVTVTTDGDYTILEFYGISNTYSQTI